MLSFWPSFSLLVFFLVIFLECRTIAGRVTLPLGSFLMVFCYGAIGAPLLALLFQQLPFVSDAGVRPASAAAWLIGLPVEELAKALPVILLAFLTRESRRLSVADLTLIGFASGAGFGFVEGNLNALVNGTLPSVQHIAAFGLQAQEGVVFFAGHPVSTALVGLAAGIGLRFLPPNSGYAWTPAAFVILCASFDHGIYNWKVLLAGNDGTLPSAHFTIEFLHRLTLNGQLQTWLLPVGLITAQFFEAHLCAKAVGARRDLLLAREWRPWVINEWLVALMRAPLGRAAFAQTWGYFRLRRAFYLATFEARRDPKDPTLSRHARSLEDRLKRERSILFDPPRGTWLLPLPVLKSYAAQWLWRMRWVLVFTVLFLFLFLLDPAGLPERLRQFLFGDIFASSVVVAGLAFAVWRIILFARLPPPDPLAAEGAACAGYYTRAMLLGSALVCGLFPTLAVLLGWKAFAPGAAFISGYLPGWIAQGGNLQALLGLGAIGAAVAPDPRPAGEALRHEIAAADDRMRRLGSEIAARIAAADDDSLPRTAGPVQLDAFLETMAKLDAERDAQARRQIALDECARQADESTIRDPAPAVEAIKSEFDQLAAELLESAARELDAIAALEQTYGRAWIEIMQDLDAHDTLRRRLKTPLRAAWQAQNEIDWALRVVEAPDECMLPMQLTLLPELEALAATARSERAGFVAEGIERIRAAAGQFGIDDPFAFAVGTNPADEDEAALLAEFASSNAAADAPKSFGLRTQATDTSVERADGHESAPEAEARQPESTALAEHRAQQYQDALDQLRGATGRDQDYLDTIRTLELSDDSAVSDAEAAATDRPQPATVFATLDPPSDPAVEISPVAPAAEPGAVEDLIDAIKRHSGYLALAKGPEAPESEAQAFADPAQAPDDIAEARDDPAHDFAESETNASAAQGLVGDEATAFALAADDTSVLADEHGGEEPRSSRDEPALESGEAETPVASQGLIQGEHAEFVLAVHDMPVTSQDGIADEPSGLHEEPAPDVGGTEPRVTTQAFDGADSVSADDAPALDLLPPGDSTRDDVESGALTVADKVEPQAAPSEDLESAERADLAEKSVDVPADEHAALETAQTAAGALVAETAIEDFYLDDVAATLPASDWPAQTQDGPNAPSAPLDVADLLIVDVEGPAPADTAFHEDVAETDTGAIAETVSRVEEPEAVEPGRPAAELEPPARTDIRSSLFARLFQSLRRGNAAAPVSPAGQDEWAPRSAEARAGMEHVPSAAPRIDENANTTPSDRIPTVSVEPAAQQSSWLTDLASPVAIGETAQTDKLSLERIEWPTAKPTSESIVAETTADATNAVEAADRPGSEAAKEPATPSADETFVYDPGPAVELQVHDATPLSHPIEDASAAADEPAILEIAQPANADLADVAAPQTSPAIASDAGEAELGEPAPSVPTIELETALVADDSADVAPDPAPNATDAADEPQSAGITAQAADAAAPAPQQIDEFASKADRLSYLLAKLEGAIKAKTAAEATAPTHEAETAPRDVAQPIAPAQSTELPVLDLETAAQAAPEPETQQHAPIVAATIETPADVAGSPKTETSALVAESNAAPSDASAPAETISVPSPAVAQPVKDDWSDKTNKTSLKPDRLSYLLTKLFETAKRQATEPAAKPQDIVANEPPASSRTEAEEERAETAAGLQPEGDHEDEILDLRLPDADEVDGQEIEFGTLREEFAEPESAIDHAEPVEALRGEPVRSRAAPDAPAPAAKPIIDVAPPADTPAAAPPATPASPIEPVTEPVSRPRLAEPAPLFGARRRVPRPGAQASTSDAKPSVPATPLPTMEETPISRATSKPDLKPSLPAGELGTDETDTPATVPRRDWKLGSAHAPRGEHPQPAEPHADHSAKKSEATLRLKTGSGALATVDAPPPGTPAAAEKQPAKYYGPKHSNGEDEETGAVSPAQQRALSLADALTEFYAKAGQPQPPMHTTDRATLQRIIANGKLEAPRRRGAPWSTSGMSRRGEVAIRLKPGAEQFIEFVPSTEIFGQVPHYYPRGVGKGSFVTHIPAGYLEYFDLATRQWAPVQRGSE